MITAKSTNSTSSHCCPKMIESSIWNSACLPASMHVCLWSYLKNRIYKLHRMLHACCLLSVLIMRKTCIMYANHYALSFSRWRHNKHVQCNGHILLTGEETALGARFDVYDWLITHDSDSCNVGKVISCISDCLCPCCKRKTARAINTKVGRYRADGRLSVSTEPKVKRSDTMGESRGCASLNDCIFF